MTSWALRLTEPGLTPLELAAEQGLAITGLSSRGVLLPIRGLPRPDEDGELDGAESGVFGIRGGASGALSLTGGSLPRVRGSPEKSPGFDHNRHNHADRFERVISLTPIERDADRRYAVVGDTRKAKGWDSGGGDGAVFPPG